MFLRSRGSYTTKKEPKLHPNSLGSEMKRRSRGGPPFETAYDPTSMGLRLLPLGNPASMKTSGFTFSKPRGFASRPFVAVCLFQKGLSWQPSSSNGPFPWAKLLNFRSVLSRSPSLFRVPQRTLSLLFLKRLARCVISCKS